MFCLLYAVWISFERSLVALKICWKSDKQQPTQMIDISKVFHVEIHQSLHSDAAASRMFYTKILPRQLIQFRTTNSLEQGSNAGLR